MNVKAQRIPDGTFLLSTDEGPSVTAANEEDLVQQMERNGVHDHFQQSLLDQLAKGNTATVEIPWRSTFSQGLPRLGRNRKS